MPQVVKNPLANAGDIGDTGLIPGLWRSPGEGNGNLFQYSCLGNPVDRGAWWAISKGSQKVGHNRACTHTGMASGEERRPWTGQCWNVSHFPILIPLYLCLSQWQNCVVRSLHVQYWKLTPSALWMCEKQSTYLLYLTERYLLALWFLKWLWVIAGTRTGQGGHSTIALNQSPGGCSKLPTQLTLIGFFTSKWG